MAGNRWPFRVHWLPCASWIVVLPCVALLVAKSLSTTHVQAGASSVVASMTRDAKPVKEKSVLPPLPPLVLANDETTTELAQEVHSRTTTTPRTGNLPKRRRRHHANETLINITAQVESMPRSSYNFTDLVLRHDLARPFTFGPAERHLPPTDRSQTWCVPSYTKRRPRHGLLLNKMPKAASSTMSGIALRIAQHYAERYFPNATANNATRTIPCNARVGHVPGYKAGQTFGHRDRMGRSFLFSTLRDPARRSLSRVYFTRVSQAGQRPTEHSIFHWLRTSTSAQYGSVSPGMGGFQLAYLAFRDIEEWSAWSEDDPYRVRDAELVHEIVREIMMEYDLLMLVERFDECLVVMQLLLGLDVGDILYLSSKHAGNYYYSPRRNECIQLAKTEPIPTIEAYLKSAEWDAMNYGDYLLYEASNQSLDLTIEALGREQFHKALDAFVMLKGRAEERCAAEAVFPCSSTGEVQLDRSFENCYDNDWGCGFPCLDALLEY
mmetsp:Transcript_18699/g.53760  ORF Transcript_18699/g.53760 Transcript_18699/m.53760 type:complete len:494 (+) Transcript_18699:235-1716(+)